jgi:ankyrin repeat protein/tetratricopeptide (TPR) repeat protein
MLTDNNSKSQIAIEYAYRFREEHPQSHVFWFYAANNTRFVESCLNAARQLQLPASDSLDVDPCELFFAWLNKDNGEKWLMVLDNADNADLFSPSTDMATSSLYVTDPKKWLVDYLPRWLDANKTLIVTTRNRHLGEELVAGESCIEVSPFSRSEASTLLRLKAGSAADYADTGQLVRLLEILGCVPLAITQAAAFMKRNRLQLRRYLAVLEKDRQSLTDHLSLELSDSRRERGLPNSIFRTWRISFHQIHRQEPRAAHLLSLMAMFDAEQIPEILLKQPNEKDLEFSHAVGSLYGLSLIGKEIEQDTYSLHRLVQLSIHQWLAEDGSWTFYAGLALKILSEKFPSGQHEDKAVCESLYPHAQAVLKSDFHRESDTQHRETLLYNVAWFEWRQGRYESSYQNALKAYNLHKNELGGSDTHTFNNLNLLALVLRDQRKYQEAEEMNRQALEGREKLLGPNHPDTLASIDNLAGVLQYQGMYEEAEAMNRRALAGREKLLGREHLDTLNSVSNLALVLKSQGKYREAEVMNWRVLEGREKTLGGEHPDTLISVSNLALVLKGQGKYREAEAMNRRALEGREKILGPEHPDTLASIDNLAEVLQYQGMYKEAEVMNRRALAGREKVLGKEHLDTLISVSSLTLVHNGQSKYQEAEAMNSGDRWGQTPLSRAAEGGHEAAVVALLATDRVDADSKDTEGQTPLSKAAEGGHEAVVAALLATGRVDANSKDTGGRTPLLWAAKGGHEAVVAALLATGRVDTNSKDTGGRTPMLWAAKGGHEAVVAALLATGRVDADSKDAEGRTPLLWAAEGGHEAVVAALLATCRVDVNSKDTEGQTPLSRAAKGGHKAVVMALLATGRVDPNSKDTEGRTPLSRAAEGGHEAVVAALLATSRVDADSAGQTPLSRAAEGGHEAGVVRLLAAGYNRSFTRSTQ